MYLDSNVARDATFRTMLLYLIEAGIQQERAVKRIL